MASCLQACLSWPFLQGFPEHVNGGLKVRHLWLPDQSIRGFSLKNQQHDHQLDQLKSTGKVSVPRNLVFSELLQLGYSQKTQLGFMATPMASNGQDAQMFEENLHQFTKLISRQTCVMASHGHQIFAKDVMATATEHVAEGLPKVTVLIMLIVFACVLQRSSASSLLRQFSILTQAKDFGEPSHLLLLEINMFWR